MKNSMKKFLLIIAISIQIIQAKKNTLPRLREEEERRILAEQILEHDVRVQQQVDAARARRREEEFNRALQQQQVAEQQRVEEAQRNQNQNRVQELLNNDHRAGPERRRGNRAEARRMRGGGAGPARNLMQAFNQPNNNLNEEFQVVEVDPGRQVVPVNNGQALNQVVINGPNRLQQLREDVFVIQNNIAAEEVEPIANLPVVH